MYVHVYLYVCVYEYMYVYVYVYMYICVSVYTYVCVCVYMYMYLYICIYRYQCGCRPVQVHICMLLYISIGYVSVYIDTACHYNLNVRKCPITRRLMYLDMFFEKSICNLNIHIIMYGYKQMIYMQIQIGHIVIHVYMLNCTILS